MVALGVFLHAVGGAAAGSFYLPLNKVRGWSWESAWLINGLFSWILAPLIVASLTVPHLFEVISSSSTADLGLTWLFGLMWGIGGLTFGLSVRYLGLSLGYAVALGFCATFGTLIPSIHDGSFAKLVSTASGWVVLSGIVVCLFGIGLCGYAGHLKERGSTPSKEESTEFNLVKGILVACFAGVMSACMAFGFTAGYPIAAAAAEAGAAPLYVNNVVLVIVLFGGFCTNVLWCIYLNITKGSYRDYLNTEHPGAKNLVYAATAGVTWYLQFFFYGMGSTQMGDYEFTSWTLHMSFVIVASNVWSLLLKEWNKCAPKARHCLILGILTIAGSTVLIGLGNAMQGNAGGH